MNSARTPYLAALALMLCCNAAATAAPSPVAARTSLRHCDAGTCLAISGRRDGTAAPIRIAGHAVDATGARHWRVLLPLDTVRAWSAPFARTIDVQVAETVGTVRLPVGLLGANTEVAFLDVTAGN